MPNHFHGLLIFHDAPKNAINRERTNKASGPTGTIEKSLGRVMQAFKSLTTNDYIHGVREQNWPPFETKLWLRNYWERVVRDENEWPNAHEYIEQNPVRWPDDKHHPDNLPPTNSQT